MTVLYTTHYMEEAQELSNRVGIIDHGQLIALGTQAELTQQVGETDTLILHSDEFQNCDALAARLKNIPAVRQVSLIDHAISIITPEAEDILAPVITAANEINFKIRSVELQEPNLEAVFLHLTGRALRD